ncbi:MAG: hypothetical protein ACI9I0_001303 [Rhodoferax sp.]|jgi:hypothetical protein
MLVQVLLPLKQSPFGWVALKTAEIARDVDFKAVIDACLLRFAAARDLPQRQMPSFVTSTVPEKN